MKNAALALVIRTGESETASADGQLRERTASQDVALEGRDVVGELVETLPCLLEGLEILLAQRRLRHGCTDRSS
jgi:hypothetical protein